MSGKYQIRGDKSSVLIPYLLPHRALPTVDKMHIDSIGKQKAERYLNFAINNYKSANTYYPKSETILLALAWSLKESGNFLEATDYFYESYIAGTNKALSGKYWHYDSRYVFEGAANGYIECLQKQGQFDKVKEFNKLKIEMTNKLKNKAIME